jgi:hypothetical protein
LLLRRVPVAIAAALGLVAVPLVAQFPTPPDCTVTSGSYSDVIPKGSTTALFSYKIPTLQPIQGNRMFVDGTVDTYTFLTNATWTVQVLDSAGIPVASLHGITQYAPWKYPCNYYQQIGCFNPVGLVPATYVEGSQNIDVTSLTGSNDIALLVVITKHLGLETVDRTDPFGQVTHGTVPGCAGDYSAFAGVGLPPSAPPAFAFAFPSGTADRRVLTHKYETADSYPLAEQIDVPLTAHPQVRINGTTMVGGTGTAGQTIYFRLVDPPDTAPYVPAADRQYGDNRDTTVKRGRLYALDDHDQFVVDGGGNRVTSNADGILATTSLTGGAVKLVLETTDYAAGDNYRIEASFNQPDFAGLGDQPCATCAKSAAYVAWKRIYLEQHWMFKRGSWLALPVVMGDTDLFLRDLHGFHNGDHVLVLHAKTGSGDDFDAEPHTVEVVPSLAGVPAHLHSTDGQLTRAYTADPDNPIISDAVGIANSTTHADDYYLPALGPTDPVSSLNSVQQYFATMFVDVQDAPTRFPFVPAYNHAAVAGRNPPAESYANRWFESLDPAGVPLPNHRALFGSNQADDLTTIGVTLLPSLHVSFSFRQRINDAVSETGGTLAGLNGLIVAYENTAHELTHQWRVNMFPIPFGGDGLGHCVYHAYDNHHLFCHMHEPWSAPSDDAHNLERGDGLMTLHSSPPPPTLDSEYLTIRTAPEPLP